MRSTKAVAARKLPSVPRTQYKTILRLSSMNIGEMANRKAWKIKEQHKKKEIPRSTALLWSDLQQFLQHFRLTAFFCQLLFSQLRRTKLAPLYRRSTCFSGECRGLGFDHFVVNAYAIRRSAWELRVRKQSRVQRSTWQRENILGKEFSPSGVQLQFQREGYN